MTSGHFKPCSGSSRNPIISGPRVVPAETIVKVKATIFDGRQN